MTYHAWRNAIKTILKDGTTYVDGDNRRCTEIQNQSMTIDNPERGVDEPYNVLRDHDEWTYPSKEQLLNVIFDDEHINSLDYTYGARLLNFDDAINQITDYVVPLLKDNPMTRRAIAHVYDPRIDSNQRRASTPGIIYFHFLQRNNALHCTAAIRSNDVFFGYPANIIQIHHVHRWVADECNLSQGSITTVSNSAHVFHDAHQDIKAVLNLDASTLTDDNVSSKKA